MRIATTLPNVELRDPTPGDADAVVALVRANLDHLAPWMGWVHPDYGHDDYDRWLAAEAVNFLIVRDGAVVGGIGLNRGDPQNLSTAIGYWLTADAQGHGVVTAAVRALAGHAFEALHVHRLELRAAPGNLRSQAVAERCGFRYEGVAREAEYIAGEFRDLRVYALLASD